jgi:hypothetical protein
MNQQNSLEIVEKPQRLERVTDLENDTDETIWLKVRARGQTFLLCNTYRPEWTDNEYWTRLSHAIGMGYQVHDNIVILGDFNSDLFIANNNKLIETMMLFSLVNIISKPTRITEHSNNLLVPGNPSLLHDLIVSSIHYPFIQVDKCYTKGRFDL